MTIKIHAKLSMPSQDVVNRIMHKVCKSHEGEEWSEELEEQVIAEFEEQLSELINVTYHTEEVEAANDL